MTHSRHRTRRTATRALGVSLIEALVAMAVMAFGMLAVMGVQTTLRLNGDISKQRSEATRIAERELERLRSFKDVQPPTPAVPGDPALYWSQVAQVIGQEVDLEGGASNTTYTMNRKVFTPAGSSQKTISVEITWQDSTGNPQVVALSDTLAGAAPVLSGLVSMPAVRTSTSQNRNRHPTIPPRAHDMGNGESVFKPLEGGTVAWTFNNTTGVITNVCTVAVGSTSATLNSGDIVVGGNCVAANAQLLSGFVRFNLRGDTVNLGATSTLTPIGGGSVVFTIDNTSQRVVNYCVDPACAVHLTPATNPLIAPPFDAVNDATYALKAVDSEDPRWPSLPLAISAGVTSGDRPVLSDECFSNAPLNAATAIGRTAVEYFCIIYPDTSGNSKKFWNGSPVVVPDAYLDDPAHPWSVGSTAGTYRVCRYTTAASNATATDNTNHPIAYTNVFGNLINQNFLIIAGQKSCPTDGPVNPAAGDFVNSNTLPHQPSS
jgi:Tfp pilus assembly protein PilV